MQKISNLVLQPLNFHSDGSCYQIQGLSHVFSAPYSMLTAVKLCRRHPAGVLVLRHTPRSPVGLCSGCFQQERVSEVQSGLKALNWAVDEGYSPALALPASALSRGTFRMQSCSGKEEFIFLLYPSSLTLPRGTLGQSAKRTAGNLRL